jgi:Tol biopolymer transport system component
MTDMINNFNSASTSDDIGDNGSSLPFISGRSGVPANCLIAFQA